MIDLLLLKDKKFRYFFKENPKLFLIFSYTLNLAILSIPLFLLYISNLEFQLLKEMTANIVKFLLEIFGKNPSMNLISGNYYIYLSSNEYIIEINRECSGYKTVVGGIISLISVPLIDPKKRLFWSLLLVPVFFISNVFRIFVTSLFPNIHDFLWILLQNVFLFVLWLYVIEKKFELRKKIKR